MSADYFHCRKKFQALPGVKTVRSGPYSFDLPPSPVQDYLAEHFTDIDAMMLEGDRAKESHRTSAAICTVPGGRKIFVKRNGNRGAEFLFKYFFIPARVFRAALAAARAEEAGIATPKVLAVGEKRRARILLGGYLVTDVVNFCNVPAFVENSPEAPAKLPALIRDAGRIAAALHGHGFYHGDLKLVNFYRTADDAPCGVWDLDSAQLFPGKVPGGLVIRELGRIVSSIVLCAERNPAFPDDFFNLDRIASDLLDAYSASAQTAPPSPAEVVNAARTRWLNKRKLRFDYGGKPA